MGKGEWEVTALELLFGAMVSQLGTIKYVNYNFVKVIFKNAAGKREESCGRRKVEETRLWTVITFTGEAA